MKSKLFSYSILKDITVTEFLLNQRLYSIRLGMEKENTIELLFFLKAMMRIGTWQQGGTGINQAVP